MHRADTSYRVLILSLNYSPELSGTAPYTTAVARGMRRRGLSTRVVAAHPHYPAWKILPGYGRWYGRECVEGVPVTRLRHYVPGRPSSVRRALSELSFGLRLIATRWGRPTVVLAVSPAMISTALARARARITHPHTPFVVWVQDLYSVGLAETGQRHARGARLIAALERRLLRSSTAVVVIHQRFADRIHDDFGVPRDRITVIPNWTHLGQIPDADVAAIRQRLGWRDDETIVLHSGNMGVKQGLHHVIDAARLANTRHDEVRFVLLGDGSQRDELRELASAEPANVEFIPPLDARSFTDALQAADVLLVHELPGVAEMAVPSKLTSYFAAGRPILAATGHGGATASEVTRAGAGIVVPAGDPAALIEGAIALAADEGRAAKYGENGRRYREAALDEGSAIDRFDSLLADLTDRARTASVRRTSGGIPS